MFRNPYSATCGLRDAGTQNSTNLIQLALQPTIIHFAGCGVWGDTNQTKIIGTPQPAFHTLRDAGFEFIKINTYKNSPTSRICGMRDAGLKNEISNERFAALRKLWICGLRDVKKIHTKIHHSAFKTKKSNVIFWKLGKLRYPNNQIKS